MQEQQAPQASCRAVKVKYTASEVNTLGIPSSRPIPEPKPCKFCGKLLDHEGILFGGQIITWWDMPQRCDCEKAVAWWADYDRKQELKEQEEKAAEKAKKQQRRIERLIGNSGIRKRFLNRTFESFKVTDLNRQAYLTAKAYAENFAEHLKNGTGINIEGTFGTGKTHLAVAIALDVMSRNYSVICKTSIDLLADIKAAFDSEEKTEEEIIEIYKTVDLLIIDDLGKEQVTEWSVSMLYSIINERYENMKPIIITTNYNEDDLIRRLTPLKGDGNTASAIISRLREINSVLTMAWTDYRGQANEQI